VPNNGLLGNTKQEYASIIQWMSFINSELFAKALSVIYPLRGSTPYNKKAVDVGLVELKVLTDVLEAHLAKNTYLVGERFSLADLYALPFVKRLFDYLYGEEERKVNPSITRWYSTLIHQEWFSGLLGDYQFRAEAFKYTPPKKEEKPKAEKPKQEKKAEKPAADEEEEESHQEKKAPHPLAALGAAKVPIDAWKRTYSNEDTREKALPWFWENYDPEEYSLWKVAYKYNSELTLTFMSNNLIGGFFNRLSASTKYMFGCQVVYGENNANGIVGVFLVRGQDYKPAFDVAPDWESYDYIKLDASKPEDKTLVEDLWAWDKPYEGKEIADGKVFK
jgi:elongation factor 1-gamma